MLTLETLMVISTKQSKTAGFIMKRLVLTPKHLVEKIITYIKEPINGRDATCHWLQMFIVGSQMQRTIQKVTQNCLICSRNNPKTGSPPIIKGVQTLGTKPGGD